MDLSVIIINYNTRKLTIACLDSLFRHTRGLTWEVILVDNASTECNPDVFRKSFPQIQVISSDYNTGFAGGNNLGLEYASGKYVLLLNSDIELKDNALFRTFQFMETNPKVGVCTIRLLYPDGRHQAVAQRFPSIRYKLAELLRIQKLLGRRRGGRLLLGSFFDFQTNTQVDWVWGAFFMFRKSILNSLPGKKLNDEYFMYGEDMQWCYDFRKLGCEVWFLGTVQAIHHMGGSFGNKAQLMKKGLDLFYKKNYGPLHRICIRFIDSLLGYEN